MAHYTGLPRRERRAGWADEAGMSGGQADNPLHGVTLEMMLNRLVARYGWEQLGGMIKIKCFNQEPSIKSSLKFLRRTPWAREKVERLYVRTPPAGGG